MSTGIIALLSFENNIYFLILIGGILSFLVILIYIFFKIKSFNSVTEINGAFIFDKEEKSIIPIPDFKVSSDMKDYITALLIEKTSEKAKFYKCNYINDKEPEDSSNDYFKYLVNSLIEYLILNKLSTSLIDYYNEKEDNVIEFDIENLQEDIAENVFLSTIAKNPETRKVFDRKNIGISEIYQINDKNEEIIHSKRTMDGYIYEKFNLFLPKHSKISKKYVNELIINTKFYKIKISWYFGYLSKVIDSEFYKYILKRKKDWDNNDEFAFDIEVEIIFKPTLVFNKNKQKHYKMLDVILNSLINYFDYDNYIEKINWSLIKNLINYYDKTF